MLLIMMPTLAHCPDAAEKHPDWKLTKCPNCGQKCFRRNVPGIDLLYAAGGKEVCTDCALQFEGKGATKQ